MAGLDPVAVLAQVLLLAPAVAALAPEVDREVKEDREEEDEDRDR